MLAQLRIRDLGVIDDAVLELSAGLNVLTGETGAGKTMVVSALGLLLGARGDTGAVRTGASACSVEGLLDVGADHPARARVAEAGGECPDEVVLVRTVTAAGRSRAHVGGRSAPVGVLGEVGQTLVAVHGQADQWRLRRPEEHRVLLDEFAGAAVAEPRAAYEQEYRRTAALTAELARVGQLERDADVEAQLLSRGLAELERLDPSEGEEEGLAAEDARLSHQDVLRTAACHAHLALAGPDAGLEVAGGSFGGPGPFGASAAGSGGLDDVGAGAGQALTAAAAALRSAAEHDAALAQLQRRIAEAGYVVADLSAELADYLAGLESDPTRHAWVQQRRADLGALLRRHGPTTADVLAWGEQAAQRLAELAGAAQRGEEVQRELAESRLRLRARADELTAARAQAAHRLAVAVTAELAQLAMPNARVHVTVEPTQRPGPHGAETVQIALAANPGSPARSVAKAASGGELSRIMLALEVVIAQAAAARRESGCGGVGTFVFDEVDAGVGGRAALAIGQRLAALARHTQVVVVTHLPQVAAFADRHLVVHKAVDGHVTASGVHPVEADERLAELARMMAGTDSALAREHAAALLREAAGRVDNTAVGVDAQPREHATRSANHLQAVPDSTSIPRGRARRGGRVAASA